MMVGKNELSLCKAEMMDALEYYFNNNVFKTGHKVTIDDVKEDKRGSAPVFIVKFRTEAEKKDEE